MGKTTKNFWCSEFKTSLLFFIPRIEELQRAIRVAEAAARSSYISHRSFLLGEQLKGSTVNAAQNDVYAFLKTVRQGRALVLALVLRLLMFAATCCSQSQYTKTQAVCAVSLVGRPAYSFAFLKQPGSICYLMR